VPIEQTRADRLDDRPHFGVLIAMNDRIDDAMQRHHIGPTTVADFLDNREFMRPNRSVDARVIVQSDPLERRDKGGLRLKEMDVGIPQGVVSVENQIETLPIDAHS